MKKDPRVYLAQIFERIEPILQYTSEGKKAFFAAPHPFVFLLQRATASIDACL